MRDQAGVLYLAQAHIIQLREGAQVCSEQRALLYCVVGMDACKACLHGLRKLACCMLCN